MGICRSTPAAARLGPLLCSGMGKPEVITAQGAGHDKLLTGSLQKDDVVGQPLSVELDTLQLQAGASWSALSQPGATARHCTPQCWALRAWEFNDSCSITVEQGAQPWLLPQCVSDRLIVEEVAALPSVKPLQLKHAQRCQLYLGNLSRCHC